MDKSNHFDIEEIKSLIKIWDVLQHFGHDCPEVCKVINSPLRDESNPSFSIFADGTMANDFGSSDSWDVISLYATLSGCSLHEAIVGCGKLAGLQGGVVPPSLSVPPPPRSKLPTPPKAKKEGFRERLGPLTDELIQQMKDCARAAIVNDEVCELTKLLKAKGIDTKFALTLVEAGVIGLLSHPSLSKPAIAWIFDNAHFGKACKLRFSAESSRETIWWQGKSAEHFFGEQLVGMPIDSANIKPMVVTEGETDALTLLQHDINCIGVCGASVIPDPRIIHYFLSCTNCAVVLDADDAGRKSTEKLQDAIMQGGTSTRVLEKVMSKIPEGMDINSCWLKWGNKFADYAKEELDRLTNSFKYNKEITPVNPTN